MTHCLPAHVSAVAIGADIVFLDVKADAYLCLVGAAGLVVVEADGGVSVQDRDAAQALIQAGLVAEGPPAPRRIIPPKPTVDPVPTSRRARSREVAALGLACVATASAFRFRTFAALIEAAGARRERHPGPLPFRDDVLDASAIFARLRPWSPVGGACLMRSHLQLQHLRRLGLDADWVIGVRTWPFMAHCWLQSGPVALDDDVERLVAYTPIRVV